MLSVAPFQKQPLETRQLRSVGPDGRFLLLQTTFDIDQKVHTRVRVHVWLPPENQVETGRLPKDSLHNMRRSCFRIPTVIGRGRDGIETKPGHRKMVGVLVCSVGVERNDHLGASSTDDCHQLRTNSFERGLAQFLIFIGQERDVFHA